MNFFPQLFLSNGENCSPDQISSRNRRLKNNSLFRIRSTDILPSLHKAKKRTKPRDQESETLLQELPSDYSKYNHAQEAHLRKLLIKCRTTIRFNKYRRTAPIFGAYSYNFIRKKNEKKKQKTNDYFRSSRNPIAKKKKKYSDYKESNQKTTSEKKKKEEEPVVRCEQGIYEPFRLQERVFLRWLDTRNIGQAESGPACLPSK